MQNTDRPLRLPLLLTSDTSHIYPVTVVATEVGNKYNIDGELQPTLIFEEGVTYRFDQSDTTNKGHPSDSLQPKMEYIMAAANTV